MASNSYFFSIVIPTLNEARYVPLLLKDLAQQTYQPFEVIVVDAHSTDGTPKKVSHFSDQLNLSLHSLPKRSASAQRNIGANLAQGEWIIFMDADNRINTTFLAELEKQLLNHPDITVFSCWIDTFSYAVADRPLIQLANIGLELYSKMKPMAPGALIGAHRSVLKKIRFNEKLVVSEDHEFVTEAMHEGFSFKIFRSPRYIFSLRRFKHEGTLKMLRVCAKAALLFIMGQKVTSDQNTFYPMNGGAQYSDPTYQPSMFDELQLRIMSASKTQIRQAKSIIDSLKKVNWFELE